MSYFRGLSFFVFLFLFSTCLFAADLKGSVQFTGAAPAPKQIDTKSDPSCGVASVPAEEVIVNSNSTLKNVFVYIKEGLPPEQKFEITEPAVKLDQKGCQYSPRVFGVRVGQPFEIVNSDPTLHNVHGMPIKSKQFNLGMPVQGMKLTRKFDQPEVMVKLKCDVHPWMAAHVGVLTHPFFSVTDGSGNFEIKNLPPGKYTLEAWHEKFGVKTQEITVAEAGESGPVSFSFAG